MFICKGVPSANIVHYPLPPRAGERLVLTCSFLAYPSSALQIVWLADHNQLRQTQSDAATASGGAGERPQRLDERFVVLFDSNLSEGMRPANNSLDDGNEETDADEEEEEDEAADQVDERNSSCVKTKLGVSATLFGGRIVVRESLAGGRRRETVLPARRKLSRLGDEMDGAEPPAPQPQDELGAKESQLVIRTAHVADSAR